MNFKKLFSPSQRPLAPAGKRRGAGGSWFWLLFFVGVPVIGLGAANRMEAFAFFGMWQLAFALLWFALAFYLPERARSVSVFWSHVADAVQRFQEKRAESSYLVEE